MRFLHIILAPMLVGLTFLTDDIHIIGAAIIAVSLIGCVRTRKNKLLLLLFAIIAFINVSIGYYTCILDSVNAPRWQQLGMISSEYNLHIARSILITNIILLAMVSYKGRENFKASDPVLARDHKTLLSFVMVAALLLIFVYAIYEAASHRGGYSSVTNPVFEYSSILITILWKNSNKKSIDTFIKLYTIAFAAVFITIGDRSCAYIILVLLYLLYYNKNTSVLKLMLIVVGGVFVTNAIAFVRHASSFEFDKIAEFVSERGLYVDTIDWSYYASITIGALHDYVDEPWRFALGYIYSFVTGLSTKYSGMGSYARDNFGALFNQGGGLYPSFFYGMGGYPGVVIGAVILGFIVNKIFAAKGKNSSIYKILLVALSFRWYLYGISTLFRGILVLTTIALIVCEFADERTYGKKKR